MKKMGGKSRKEIDSNAFLLTEGDEEVFSIE